MMLRPEVQAFAEAMERKLRANDHKCGWKDCRPSWLMERLLEEVNELDRARPDKVLDEAADVGNFAMMIADVLGVLKQSAPTVAWCRGGSHFAEEIEKKIRALTPGSTGDASLPPRTAQEL